MFSKFLRRISVAVIGVIFLLGAFSGMSLCAKAQSPGTGELEVFQIEQVRAEMPQIQVYVRGVNANEACEAYLDGNALTSTGNQSLDENGTSYLIMLDISGSITSEYFLAAKKQVEELAQNLGPKDKITLITFGDTVKMQVSDSQNADEISKILALLQAKDKKTNLNYVGNLITISLLGAIILVPIILLSSIAKKISFVTEPMQIIFFIKYFLSKLIQKFIFLNPEQFPPIDCI